MSQDFGINNSGQGFFFDDDDDMDLDEMLEKSNRAAEDFGDDSDLFFTPEEETVEEETFVEKEVVYEEPKIEDDNSWGVPEIEIPVFDEPFQPEAKQEKQNPIYIQKEEQQEPVKFDSEAYQERTVDKHEDSHVAASDPHQKPRRQVTEAATTVEETKPVTQSYLSPVKIKNETEEISEIQKVIEILDTYRKLSKDVRNVVSQFVGNEDDNNEAVLVVKVLRADEMLYKTMTALKEAASETDRVERVFYILRLDENLLHGLGELVNSIFSDNPLEVEESDKIGYAKAVEGKINEMDKKVIDYVTATQSVLAASGNI